MTYNYGSGLVLLISLETERDQTGTSKTVASGSSCGREAQPYQGTASIAGRKCNAQQVFEVSKR
jgi:hypothetical protein